MRGYCGRACFARESANGSLWPISSKRVKSVKSNHLSSVTQVHSERGPAVARAQEVRSPAAHVAVGAPPGIHLRIE